MSVRYRLFLWVGSLFLIAFIISALLQSKLTDQNLIEASGTLKEKLLKTSDLKRSSIEKFIRMTLAGSCGEIKALLDTVGAYKTYESSFAPIGGNDHNYNWSRSADLLIDNKWIDFVQNLAGSNVLSVLTPNDAEAQMIQRKIINDDFAWISFSSDPNIYLGVRCQKIDGIAAPLQKADVELIGQKDPHMYFVFSKEALSILDGTWPIVYDPLKVKYIAPYFFEFYGARNLADFISSFSDKLQKTFDLLSAWPSSHDIFSEQGKEPSPSFSDPIDQSFQELLKRNRIIAMVAFLASYYATEFTGDSPDSLMAPLAMSYFIDGSLEGIGIFSKHVFRTKSFEIEDASKEIILIPDLDTNRVYVGETMIIQTEEDQKTRAGTLTIGINPTSLGKFLALSNRETTLVVSQNQIIGAFSLKGEEIDKGDLDKIPTAKMVLENKGFVKWKGEDYFFLQITPFEQIDLHFFLLNPKEKEFAVIQYLEEGTKTLIDTISVYMRQIAIVALIVVLVCLNYLAKKMTKPIIQLAKATEKVAQGSLEEVDLSFAGNHSQDEIYVLCNSFAKMVQGLQEKEKVRSVLNKVVSVQIASQILQSPIQLGGEERRMTMLFADIRNFTRITEKMSPQDVIEMLNQCMTKLSDQIDIYGGVIDKYVGDEVMALFGLPEHGKDTVLSAILSSLGMLEALKISNQTRQKEGLPSLEIGVGIHSGIVLAGNMGAKNRLNYTVLGREVNLGARLCAMAGGGEIFVTEAVALDPEVQANIRLEKTEPMIFKGFSEPIVVYKVIGKIC